MSLASGAEPSQAPERPTLPTRGRSASEGGTRSGRRSRQGRPAFVCEARSRGLRSARMEPPGLAGGSRANEARGGTTRCKHQHSHLRARVARGQRLTMCPHAQHRVASARVELRYHGDLHGSLRAACGGAVGLGVMGVHQRRWVTRVLLGFACAEVRAVRSGMRVPRRVPARASRHWRLGRRGGRSGLRRSLRNASHARARVPPNGGPGPSPCAVPEREAASRRSSARRR